MINRYNIDKNNKVNPSSNNNKPNKIIYDLENKIRYNEGKDK